MRADPALATKSPRPTAFATSRRSLRGSAQRSLFVSVWLLLNCLACCADAQTLRLRVAWGGGEEQIWRGTIRVEPGEITEHQALGIEPDEPGSMWIDNGQLEILQRSPHRYDGVDIAVQSNLDGHLTVSLLTGPSQDRPQTFEIPLLQLRDELFSANLDKQQNRLLVRRAPGDKLRVRVGNPSLVLAPEEKLQLELSPHLVGDLAEGVLRIQTQLVPARGGDSLWDGQQQADVVGGIATPLSLEIPAPQKEGVYDLEIEAFLPNARRQFHPGNPFRNRQQVAARRKVQFVVVRPNLPDPAEDEPRQPPSKVIDEINPAEPWWKKVARIPRLPGLSGGPLQHGDVTNWEHPQLGTMVRIGPGSSQSEASWTAYPLNISHPGQPHILDVAYPTHVPQAMGISILEPNAAGSVLPVGLDSGIYVPPEAADFEPALGRQRIVFWPKTRQPVVLITNQRDDANAVHGKIRVLGPKAVAVAGLNLAGSPTTGLPSAMPAGILDEGRTLAAFMQRPLFPENFSAQEAFDPWSQRSMDDWLTFYDAATRLVQYLKYAGYNSLVLAVAADGSAIYPTRLLEPTPRYDTGIFFASGQDPQRKDVLELLFRLCDRQGLRLIPALQFSTPLPQLEAVLRQGGPDSAGVAAVGPDGVSASYNPLHPLVQQAMVAVVRELVDRYRHHPSFDGLAIGTSEHSFAFFPGPLWPADPRTRQQFAQEAGVALPPGDHRLLMESPLLKKWLDWRAYRLRQFHGLLTDELQRAGLEGKLYLSLSPMLDSPEIQRMLRPALPPRAKPLEGLWGIGINPQLYATGQAASPSIILFQPASVTPDFPLERRAVVQQLPSSEELLGQAAAGGHVGVLQSIGATSLRLKSFDQQSPFGPDRTHIVLSPHLTAAGRSSRRRVVRALADLDTAHILYGGQLLPLGQEEQLRDIVIAYRRLPAQKFQPVPGKYQPLKLRQLSRQQHTYLYLVNDAPWPCQCTMRIVTPGAVAVEELSGLRQVEQPADGNWSVTLESYDFLAVRFPAAQVQVADVQVTVPDQFQAQLRRRLQRLVARAASLDEKRPMEGLENAGFEAPAVAGNVPGWKLIGDPQAAVTTDLQEQHVGQACLQFRGQGPTASLISNSFAAPRTGRLAFTVWLKASPDFQGPLRLAVGGTHGQQEYYRHGVARPNGTWKLFEFSTDDLPFSDITNLHVRFDMQGAGTVWIDEITVSDLRFSENERTELSRLLTRAHFTLESGQLADCLRLLEGYWPDFLERHIPLADEPLAEERPLVRQAIVPPRPEALPPAPEPWWKRRLQFWK